MSFDVSYEPADLLAELKAKTSQLSPACLPNRLPLKGIRQIPKLFQPRGMDERHVSELARVILNVGAVDPVTVIQVGQEAVLIDGHHRLAAYALAKRTTDIPVRYFEGTLDEAVLEAGAANSKAKLPMSSQERQDFAWRLVLMDRYSKADIAQASGVSTSQVSNMRTVRRQLGADAFDCRSWWQARRTAKGAGHFARMTDEEREQWLEEQANRYADRLAKEFGNKLSNNPEVAAMALAAYFGRRLPDVVDELRHHIPDVNLEDCEDDF
ncbi:ParB/RepB/Spo0J family partition protein [Microvirga roseola]|uniref:ParB/RepB/Spo0J family partition protein n=1 Tax=Microvirga roseola TaxID=2883126 RepID=UPI001E5289D5|nr:ParB N-terminal domain-containing protein [Microvirga roseola]